MFFTRILTVSTHIFVIPAFRSSQLASNTSACVIKNTSDCCASDYFFLAGSLNSAQNVYSTLVLPYTSEDLLH